MISNSRPLIVCVTETEYLAVKKRFTSVSQEIIGSNVIEHGYFADKLVALCKIMEMGGKGGESIPLRLPSILNHLRPSFAVELGICFGLKSDFKIGEVGVCQYSHDYEYQKVNEDEFQFRGKSVKSAPDLYAKLIVFASTFMGGYKAKGVHYACGDKVVNSESLKSQILKAVPEASCGDMESFSFGLVCDNANIPWLVIKASSDDGVNKGDEFQVEAASNSANFFEQFIKQSADLNEFFGDPEEVVAESQSDFEYISQTVFGSAPSKIEVIGGGRASAYLHYHPELDGAWVIVYVSRAHSIPEILKQALRRIGSVPAKLDLCIATGGSIHETNIRIYAAILDEAGVRKHLISNIGGFVFETVVRKKVSAGAVPQLVNYVDQAVFRGDVSLGQGRVFARSFLATGDDQVVAGKPIAVVLGQGGVGKTTFCRNLVRFINESDDFSKKVLLVTKADIQKNYSGEMISSIEDLYREYVRGVDDRSQSISQREFSLALSCGSIVLMIDGIDEIESALGDKFDLEGFVDSISNLNRSLRSCRVLLTSRDVHRTRFEHLTNADIVSLRGFSDKDVDAFLSRESLAAKREVSEYVKRIRDGNNFVNPYLLHVVRQFVSSESGTSSSLAISTNRLNVNDSFDYILARLLQREIDKQSLSVGIDDYYDLLIEVVVAGRNELSVDDFEAYIQTLMPSRFNSNFAYHREPYLKFFLLEQNGNKISVTHLEYVAHILLNRLIELFSLVDVSVDKLCADLELIFGEAGYHGFALSDRLMVRLSKIDASRELVEGNIKKAVLWFGRADRSTRRERTLLELYIFAFEYSGCRSAVERRDLLIGLHGSTTISRLCVVGDFPKIDFSGLIVEDAIFRNFGDFFLCAFDSDTIFLRCSFFNCSRKFNKANARMDMFRECQLDDGMKSLLSAGADKRKEVVGRVKADIKQVFRAMRDGLGFTSLGLNRIKAHTNIVSELSYEDFLRILVSSDCLQYDGELYRVPRVVELDALALCEEDHVQGVVAAAVQKMCG